MGGGGILGGEKEKGERREKKEEKKGRTEKDPKKNFLQFGRNPVLGGIPFWEESRFGRNPILGGIPGGRSSVGEIPGGRSSLGGILFFSCVERFKLVLLDLIPGEQA